MISPTVSGSAAVTSHLSEAKFDHAIASIPLSRTGLSLRRWRNVRQFLAAIYRLGSDRPGEACQVPPNVLQSESGLRNAAASQARKDAVQLGLLECHADYGDDGLRLPNLHVLRFDAVERLAAQTGVGSEQAAETECTASVSIPAVGVSPSSDARDETWASFQQKLLSAWERHGPIIRGRRDGFLDLWRDAFGDTESPIDSLDSAYYWGTRIGLSEKEIDGMNQKDLVEAVVDYMAKRRPNSLQHEKFSSQSEAPPKPVSSDPSFSKWSPAAVKDWSPRLVLDVQQGIAHLDGERLELKPDAAIALCFLVEAYPQRVGLTTAGITRPDRMHDGLPGPIRDLVERPRGGGKGYRLRLPSECQISDRDCRDI